MIYYAWYTALTVGYFVRNRKRLAACRSEIFGFGKSWLWEINVHSDRRIMLVFPFSIVSSENLSAPTLKIYKYRTLFLPLSREPEKIMMLSMKLFQSRDIIGFHKMKYLSGKIPEFKFQIVSRFNHNFLFFSRQHAKK